MDFVRAVYEVARNQVLQHIRTKRLLVIGLFFFLVLQLVTLVIPLSFGLVDDAPENGALAHENTWFFVHLNASIFGGLFGISLLCIVLTADAVCSEWSNRTIFLLLSKPVSRTAFVVGKYLGSFLSIMPTVIVLYVLQYIIMMAVFPGQPSGDEVLGFVKMLGMLASGAMAVSAVALFFSTLTRSVVMALVLSFLTIFLLFPILGLIGDIKLGIDESQAFRNDQPFEESDAPDPKDWKYDWSHYVTPGSAFSAAPPLLSPDKSDDLGGSFAFVIPQVAPQRTWLAAVSGVAFTLLFVGLSVLRVNKRNFE